MVDELAQAKRDMLAAEKAAKHSQQEVDQLQDALKKQTITPVAVKPNARTLHSVC